VGWSWPLPTVVSARRFVAARIRLDLRTVDGHSAQLNQPAVLCDQNHLPEQLDKLLEVLLPKIADRPVLRKVPCRQHPEGHVLFDLLRDPSRPVAYA
jgi:hypothetical protein